MNSHVSSEKITLNKSDNIVHSLEAIRLECTRNDLILFSNLDFHIEAGEILQVHGANGSGKTSLLRILCGLALPNAGEVFWIGSNIQDLRSGYLRELNYIGHSNGIKAELTPLENIIAIQALTVQQNNISHLQALEQMGIVEFKDIPVRKLSSGQRRRVALSRLLVTQASLWILDEPFTALDESGKQLTHQLIEKHTQDKGITVIVTHEDLNIPENKIKKLVL